MNVNEIKELVRIMDQSDVAEITWENGDQKLVIRKAAAMQPAPVAVPAPAPQVAPAAGVAQVEAGEGVSVVASAAAAGRAAAADAAGAALPPAQDDAANLVSVVSPMVGTFYRAPAPDAPPYVEVGSVVDEGDPLCIIEAMKLMNEIESEVRGRVREILVQNGDPVEYGQVLFILEKMP